MKTFLIIVQRPFTSRQNPRNHCSAAIVVAENQFSAEQVIRDCPRYRDMVSVVRMEEIAPGECEDVR